MFRAEGTYKIEGYNHVGVYITPLALQKMKAYVMNCTDEIGWLGEVIRKDNVFLITDTILFEQEVHATTTEISAEDIIKVAEQILAEPNGMERYERIKMWGHSHVNMGVSPSGQDESQMRVFEQGNDFFIRIIANKKGDMRVDVYDYKSGIIHRCVRWEIFTETLVDEKAIKDEMALKVKKKTYITTHQHGYTQGYGGYSTQGKIYSGYQDDYEDYGYYGRTKPSKQKKTKRTTLIKSNIEKVINKPSDLIDILGFTEDEVIALSECISIVLAREIVEEALFGTHYTVKDLEVVMDFANAYVFLTYGE